MYDCGQPISCGCLGAGTRAAVAGRVTGRSSAAAWRVAATAAVAPAATPAAAARARAPVTGAARAIHFYADVSRFPLRNTQLEQFLMENFYS